MNLITQLQAVSPEKKKARTLKHKRTNETMRAGTDEIYKYGFKLAGWRGTAKQIAEKLNYTHKATSERMLVMEDRGLVKRDGCDGHAFIWEWIGEKE